MPASRTPRTALVKALLLVMFIAAALFVVYYTGLEHFLTVDNWGNV